MDRKVATAIIILVLLVMAGVPARADAASSEQRDNDLTSLAKIEAYLGTMGIAIDSVVVQQGRYNYAGPNCPGAEWNCATASMVVQISTSTSPSANVVDCSPAVSVALLGLDECVIVQSSVSQLVETTNMASCDMSGESDGKTKQKCKVKQHSKKGSNSAEVRMRTTQRGEFSETATQVAEIEQSSDSGSNRAKITQTMEQTLSARQSGSVTQSQVACQNASVTQTSTTTGSSSSDVQQYQTQIEDAASSASITQEQNLTTDATNCPFNRNQLATINQLSDTGDIASNLRQLITQRQDADSPLGPVTQTQSNATGGLDGKVTQDTTAPGVLRTTSVQDEPQTQHADTASVPSQLQFGPEFCCGKQFGGTEANVNTVFQSNVQHNDTGTGQSTNQQGDCVTTGGGDCTASQTYTNNSGTTSDSETAPAVSCNNVGEGASCFPVEGEG